MTLGINNAKLIELGLSEEYPSLCPGFLDKLHAKSKQNHSQHIEKQKWEVILALDSSKCF